MRVLKEEYRRNKDQFKKKHLVLKKASIQHVSALDVEQPEGK